MHKVVCILFVFLSGSFCASFAQSSSSYAQPISSAEVYECHIESSQGMQFRTTNPPPPEPLLNYQIEVFGSVTYVANDTAKLLDQFPTEPVGRVVRIGNASATAKRGQDSLMLAFFDSNYVYVPYSLDVEVGDSLYIKNYSAYFYMYCEADGWVNYPKGYFTGEYHVIRDGVDAIGPEKTARTRERAKPHNRDAGGRLFNGCDAYKIRY